MLQNLKKQKIKLNNYLPYFGMLIFFSLSLLLKQDNIPPLSLHISNFAFTGGALVLSLFFDLRKSISKLSFYSALIFWAMVNIFLETFIRIDTLKLPGVDIINFNTPDIIDAIFGIAAIAIYYLIVLRYCVKTMKD